MFMLEVYLNRDESQASNKSVLTSEKFLTKSVQELHDLVQKQKLTEQKERYNETITKCTNEASSLKESLKDKDATISQLTR